MKRKEFFNYLPYINFILSIMIVMHHSFNINVDYNTEIKGIDWALERFFYNISECAVPIFFFISAILFYRNYEGTKKDYFYKVKKRIGSILIPYVIFNTIGYLKHVLFSHDSFTIIGLLKSIAISDTMPLWFLRELFILVLLTPIIFRIRRRKILIGGGYCGYYYTGDSRYCEI